MIVLTFWRSVIALATLRSCQLRALYACDLGGGGTVEGDRIRPCQFTVFLNSSAFFVVVKSTHDIFFATPKNNPEYHELG